MAGTVTIGEGASIGGDVIAIGGSITIGDGSQVSGDVRGTALRLMVDGHIGGDVGVNVDRLIVASSASIEGGLRYWSTHDAVVEGGATVVDPTVHRDAARLFPGGALALWRSAAIPRLLVMRMSGAVGVLFLSRALVAIANVLPAAPLTSMLVGVGITAFVPIILLMLAITVVGLPIVLPGALA